MKIVLVALGAVGVLLGGLWLLQGLGLLHMEPIFCVAECETLEGPSPVWALVGLLLALAGALAVWFGLRRRGSR